jgi:adenine deaminase
MMDKRLIAVACGKEAADLVIKNGLLINVHSAEVYEADVAIVGSRIAAVGQLPEAACGVDTQIVDAKGKYLAPGFIDAHIHIESSMLSYSEFAKMVVKRGTTAVATDLMEVTIVSGVEGMMEVLAEAEGTPVKLYYVVPAFMEESGLQTTGSTLKTDMMEELIQLPQAIGLAEVLAPPILAGSDASAKILELAKKYKKTAEGHAPALYDGPLNAIASAGVNSDHESTNKEEALQKLRAGLRVLMREGSASTDLRPCLKIITDNNVDARHCCMVSDDIDALHIKDRGHLDNKVRIAIEEGVDPVTAIQMVTLNPAESFRIDGECGSISPGKYADIVLLSSLEKCQVDSVVAKGQLVVADKKVVHEFSKFEYSDKLRDTVHLPKVTGDDLLIKVDKSACTAKAHVIGASPISLLTESLVVDLPVVNGVVQADLDEDIIHIACVERYGKNGSIGKSFVKNFGLKSGAVAISVAHDHHNVMVVGVDKDDMALAVNRIQDLEGGLVYVDKGKVIEELALPICGLLADEDGDIVAEKLRAITKAMSERGCTVPSPNVTLSFISLIFIPELAITDQGLFDVASFSIIEPVISVN